jgi:tetratricopeptide (TPR) repeat protein
VYLGVTWLLLVLPMAAPGQKVDRPARTITSDDEIAKAVELTRTRPSDAAWSQLGDVFMQKARETFDLSYYARAEAAYRKAIDLNATQVDALAGMAWVESARHEFEQSIDWANRALAVQPDRAYAHGLLGDAAVEMGDYDKAFEHYQKMLDIRPDVSSYSRAAHLLFLTGDVKKAIWLMMKAIAAGAPYAENTAWCRAQLALMQFAEGGYLSASQVLADALAKAPGNYHVLAALGKVRAALKDYPAAIDYYKRAEAVVPQHEVVVALGDIYAFPRETARG